LLRFCNQHNIQTEAWSPIMQGRVNQFPLLVELARKYNKSPAQIVLRWDLQKKVVTIPKSSNKDSIIENGQIFDFKIEEDDMIKIDSLDKGYRLGEDPYNINF
ncbi:MAG: aldo/keto reductase, partial [Melioribacteraceae bacterium]|nr:aldo/keto reductase [Melioribacteraceae bacterium]